MCNLNNERGQGMVEYILIVIMIGIALVTVLGEFGGILDSKLSEVKAKL
jgi:Flp pilus assembly pilin Flp